MSHRGLKALNAHLLTTLSPWRCRWGQNSQTLANQSQGSRRQPPKNSAGTTRVESVLGSILFFPEYSYILNTNKCSCNKNSQIEGQETDLVCTTFEPRSLLRVLHQLSPGILIEQACSKLHPHECWLDCLASLRPLLIRRTFLTLT